MARFCRPLTNTEDHKTHCHAMRWAAGGGGEERGGRSEEGGACQLRCQQTELTLFNCEDVTKFFHILMQSLSSLFPLSLLLFLILISPALSGTRLTLSISSRSPKEHFTIVATCLQAIRASSRSHSRCLYPCPCVHLCICLRFILVRCRSINVITLSSAY